MTQDFIAIALTVTWTAGLAVWLIADLTVVELPAMRHVRSAAIFVTVGPFVIGLALVLSPVWIPVLLIKVSVRLAARAKAAA